MTKLISSTKVVTQPKSEPLALVLGSSFPILLVLEHTLIGNFLLDHF